jgi:predicted  nucleic acid-binding Zn-ribbon protein
MAKTTRKKEMLEETFPIENIETTFSVHDAEVNLSDEITVEDKLIALFKLQLIDSKIDKIRTIRGELPLEVQDLEDQCSGLETRINKFLDEIKEIEIGIQDKNNAIKESKTLIKRYEEQQNNVRNNREYEALSKEINFQNLEIILNEKRVKELSSRLEDKKNEIELTNNNLSILKSELELKRSELDDIIAETEKEERDLSELSQGYQRNIDNRLLKAYKSIRGNARNGLAIVQIERDACGGCFNKIPPQRHLDIKMHKKIIVCEYCGRILVDEEISEIAHQAE